MTKNDTIYLTKIIKFAAYGSDLLVELEAFDTLEKAKAFMESCGMTELKYNWISERNGNLEGSITELKVK